MYANHYKHNTGGARTNDRSSAVDVTAWKFARIKRHKVLVIILIVFYNFGVLTLRTDHSGTCLHKYLYLNIYLTLLWASLFSENIGRDGDDKDDGPIGDTENIFSY